MTQYYSRSDTAYSGSAIFSIPFSYINKNNINVKIIREVSDEETEIDATFTWLNDTQITVTSELQAGDVVSIRRNTPIDQKIVTYQNQSMILDEDNLNLSQDQLLNVVQEMYDNNVTFEIQVEGDIGDIDTKVNSAINKADSAISTANSADSKADTAISTANTASTNASSAVTTANNAASTANTASTNASNAVNTANNASSTATSAKNKVDTLETDIQSVIAAAEKINELEEAVTTATNAATTATNKATEATNAANRAEAVIPTQTGQNGKFLQTNGSSTQWAEVDLTTKQDTLVSGTNIKTINNNSILGSGDLTLDGLPSQSGQSGKFLTTDGSSASWTDSIATDLSGKVDKANLAPLPSDWCLPSNTYIDLILGANGTAYTAPADGYYFIQKTITSNTQSFRLINTSKSYEVASYGTFNGSVLALLLPVAKGDIAKVAYDAAGTTNSFRFYYAVGSESEA